MAFLGLEAKTNMSKDFKDTRFGRKMLGEEGIGGSLIRDKWPKDCGDISLKINRDGVWFYSGSSIQRIELAQLFASVLQVDDEMKHWLVTPFERIFVEVEDAPFVATMVEISDDSIIFTTNLRQKITLNEKNYLFMKEANKDGSAESRPYLRLENGLLVRLSRSTFYHLVDMAELDSKDQLYVTSFGQRFYLGSGV